MTDDHAPGASDYGASLSWPPAWWGTSCHRYVVFAVVLRLPVSSGPEIDPTGLTWSHRTPPGGAGAEGPRTRLEQVLRQRRLTVDQFRKDYAKVAGAGLSERQAYRWVAGDVAKLPYPHAQAALEHLFGEPAARLFGPPYGGVRVVPPTRLDLATFDRGCARTDWEGQVISMSADRAREFLARAAASNVGPETIDQLTDDVRRLVVRYQQQPLAGLLTDMAETQDRAFGLLEGRQKPEQTRDLYMLAGVASGLLAKVSHDLGASHDALTQARAACADNAGHDGLRVWIRGLQTLITYWAGRFDDSIRYARLGAEPAERTRSTASIWLASGEARSLAEWAGTRMPTRPLIAPRRPVTWRSQTNLTSWAVCVHSTGRASSTTPPRR